jgi:hypothetical protein
MLAQMDVAQLVIIPVTAPMHIGAGVEKHSQTPSQDAVVGS